MMDDDAERSAAPNTWLREFAIAVISVVVAIFAVLTAMFFVSGRPWFAIGTMMGSAALGYAAYLSFLPEGVRRFRKFSWIAILWIITTVMAVLLLSAEKWWK